MHAKTTLLGLAFLLACGCGTKSILPGTTPPDPVPTINPTASAGEGQTKFGLFMVKLNDPWIERQELHASQTARQDHGSIIVYHESDTKQLVEDMADAAKRGAKGAIVFAPDCRDGNLVVASANADNLKLLLINNQLQNAKLSNAKPAELMFDYAQAGDLAGKTMIKEALTRKKPDDPWDMTRTGAIVFVSDKLGQSQEIASHIEAILVANGVSKDRILELPASDGKISSARKTAAATLDKHRLIHDWFVTGYSDAVAIGGIRAIEDAHIGNNRVVGVGIGGDGAIYDLQRPRFSGLVASVLLPAGTMGDKSAHEMYNWIENKIRPINYDRLPGILLDRRNVRQLKGAEHLLE